MRTAPCHGRARQQVFTASPGRMPCKWSRYPRRGVAGASVSSSSASARSRTPTSPGPRGVHAAQSHWGQSRLVGGGETFPGSIVEPSPGRAQHLEARPRPDEALDCVEGLDDDSFAGRGSGDLDDRPLVQVRIPRLGDGHGEPCVGTVDDRAQKGAFVLERAAGREWRSTTRAPITEQACPRWSAHAHVSRAAHTGPAVTTSCPRAN